MDCAVNGRDTGGVLMRVLVAVDKHEESFNGLKCACHFLENLEASLDVLHVKPDITQMAGESYAPFFTADALAEAMESESAEIGRHYQEASHRCRAARIPCEFNTAVGDPADEILHAAQTDGYDMIVLGSHDQSAVKGLLLGAVHAKILHYAEQPVLIVRQFREIRRVLVVYRGSQTDEAAVRFIAPLLSPKRPELTLLHVLETGKNESDEFARTSLQKGAQILRGFDYEPITKMTRGEFVEEILKDVAIHRYDLVVLGAYGHKRPKYLKLISDDALNLARLTTRPILVFREKKGQ
jgi:nucleotide-binding universal stress UspA family protein